MNRTIRTEEPHDRLTRICDSMSDTFSAHEEREQDDKCIIFLTGSNRSGLVLTGYENDSEAMADLLIHLKAMFAANGKQLHFHALQGGEMS